MTVPAMKFRILPIWSIPSLLILLFVFQGCAPDNSRTSTAPLTFVFARGADAQKLDPADVDDGESVNTMAQIFEGLLGFGEGSLEVVPVLAERFEISEDGLEYTFHLREGVRGHSGTPRNPAAAR